MTKVIQEGAAENKASIDAKATPDSITNIVPTPDEIYNSVKAAANETVKSPKRDADKDPINDEFKTVKKEETDIDLSALFEGTELTEEFKDRVNEILESVVEKRVEKIKDLMVENFDNKIKENFVIYEEKVDEYLNHTAEKWLTENKLAVEAGWKSVITENFIVSLHKLFKENYIEVPDDKLDILNQLQEQVAELNNKLNEEVQKNIDLSNVISDAEKKATISEMVKDLPATQAEKIVNLMEEIKWEDKETFVSKIVLIKETFLTNNTDTKERKELIEESFVEGNDKLKDSKQIDPLMQSIFDKGRRY